MNDLISRKTLLEIIAQTKRVFDSENQDYYKGYMCALSGLEGVIAGQPTAYDVDKVVAELHREHFTVIDDYTEEWEDVVFLEEAIGIVKGGGVNE